MEEYEATPWHDSVEGATERTLTYKVPLSANLGPKWAEVIEKQVSYILRHLISKNCQYLFLNLKSILVPFDSALYGTNYT